MSAKALLDAENGSSQCTFILFGKTRFINFISIFNKADPTVYFGQIFNIRPPALNSFFLHIRGVFGYCTKEAAGSCQRHFIRIILKFIQNVFL